MIRPEEMRRIILSRSRRANVGHIGSCLCVVEILAALYGNVLRVSEPSDPDRDRFVLSKGHAGLALYAALALRGWISSSELDTFCGESSYLGVHPESALKSIDFSSGSLGHGLSYAAGAALAARMQQSARRAFCLLSDGECNEGSVWEAAAFAGHHKLGHLVAIVDWNGQQALGRTRDVQDDSALAARWRSFGWRVSETDGHDVASLVRTIGPCEGAPDPGAPHIILARTTFGKGVSYMEKGVSPARPQLPQNPINWHYLPMTDDEYVTAMAEVGTA